VKSTVHTVNLKAMLHVRMVQRASMKMTDMSVSVLLATVVSSPFTLFVVVARYSASDSEDHYILWMFKKFFFITRLFDVFEPKFLKLCHMAWL